MLGPGTHANPAVGVWADGAENSTEIRVGKGTKAQQEYVASLLGKSANQKAVLNWRLSANGPDILHAIETKDDLGTLNTKLEKAGIEFRAIEASPDGKSATAYVLDQDGSLAEKV